MPRLEYPACSRYLIWPLFRLLVLVAAASFLFARTAKPQSPEETLSGPDSQETGQGPHGHLFGTWGGERTRLEGRGVVFDFQYVSDSLWNIKSEQQERSNIWNRFRWTVDIDFAKLTGTHDLYFHAAALWQNGANIGAYLGTLANPSILRCAIWPFFLSI